MYHLSKKGGKIRKRYNHVPHMTKDTTWESDKTHNYTSQTSARGQPFNSR